LNGDTAENAYAKERLHRKGGGAFEADGEVESAADGADDTDPARSRLQAADMIVLPAMGPVTKLPHECGDPAPRPFLDL
jgi:hypothetical protein